MHCSSSSTFSCRPIHQAHFRARSPFLPLFSHHGSWSCRPGFPVAILDLQSKTKCEYGQIYKLDLAKGNSVKRTIQNVQPDGKLATLFQTAGLFLFITSYSPLQTESQNWVLDSREHSSTSKTNLSLLHCHGIPELNL